MRSAGAWRLDPSVTFLNHGSFGACPEPVIAAQARWRDRLEARPVQFLGRDLEGLLDHARSVVGVFLRADPEGLAFVANATTAINTVLRSLRFEAGDELLATDHEYNATLNALGEVARRDGAKIVLARIPFPIESADQALEAVLAAVTPRTRLALVSHVTSPTAVVFPIERIVRKLEDRGIDTLVDAAHAPGMVPIDVDNLAPAYWAGDGHKWLCGPKGSAVLWVRADRRGRIRPLVISHGANDPRRDRARFRLEFDWVGTTDPTASLAMVDAHDLVGGLHPRGWPGLMAANHDLVVRGRDVILATLRTPCTAPDTMVGSMASIVLPVPANDDVAERIRASLFENAGIEVPVFGWPARAAREDGSRPQATLIRISAQLYNELADFERLAAALPDAIADAIGQG